MSLAPGVQLGPYEVRSMLGSGGMGEVYRAKDTKLNRDVALKVLREVFTLDPDRLARFRREAQVLASLNHPNIAAIYGFEESNGTQALVLELVEGPTLADRIAQGPLPLDEALPVAKQIAEALEGAHEQGIIHRDLKPANIKLRPDGTVKVLDFGLAKALEPTTATGMDATASPTITSPAMMTGVGVLLGTAAYMSPEQARGKAVDKRSDIWAFGCVLYEMLTGQRAFGGEDVTDTLAAVVKSEPAWEALPGDVSPSVRVFLRRCLQKNPKQRLHDIADMRLALEGVFETAAPQVAPAAAVAQPVWRRPLAVAGATAIVALLVTALAARSLWPTVAPPAVNRFEYALPADQGFTRLGRPVLALSSDGRRFVYNTAKGLYLRTMGELEARLISGTEEVLNTPFFSPDGQSVGYYAAAGNQLKRIAITGGAPVKIADAVNPFGASWGADGTILFGQPKGIMRVSANGGTPELVIPAKEGEQVDSPQLLPDGDSVLFTVTTASGSTRWDEAQIVVQSLSTGARTVVVQGGSDARYVPTGHLIYALEESLFAVAFDPASHTVSGGPVSVVQGVARTPDPATLTATANYGVSNDGALVYVAGGFVDFRLVWVDRQGRETPLAAPTRPYAQPRVSPDGSRVAVVVEGDIWVWDNVRGTLTRLTFDASEEVSPLWTADGTRIAFASRDKGIFWKAIDGTDESQRLLDTPRALPSAWAPDGTLLYYTSDIGRLSMAGAPKAETLLGTNFVEARPALSPDGRWLAYESNESGQFEIYVRPFPDISRGRWLVSTSGGVDPLWAPDGHALFYRSSMGTSLPNQRLMSITVESKDAAFVPHAPESLFSVAGINVVSDAHNYDVAPDGERFLFAKAFVRTKNEEGSSPFSRIIIVENWLEELKRLVPVN
jgi:eukaryotic-like serine/threonine-protein kinase